jgi:hypothetical protein
MKITQRKQTQEHYEGSERLWQTQEYRTVQQGGSPEPVQTNWEPAARNKLAPTMNGITDSRTVTILWEEGGISSQQGDITDEQWEVFKLAFMSTGRVAILSDQLAKDWMYDYRFLEAVRW